MGQWKGDKGLNNITVALLSKVPKIQRPKALKIYVFDYPTIV